MEYKVTDIKKVSRAEFNDFLKSINGLERTWNLALGPIFDVNCFDIKQGWYGLTKQLIEELIKLGWNRRIYSVITKLGGLRFYAIDTTKECDALIANYESLSYNICEECGDEAKMIDGATLCDKHRK